MDKLTDYVGSQNAYRCGGSSYAIAKALASNTGWTTYSGTCAVGNNQSTNNAIGFGALPAGNYYSYGYYFSGDYAPFWSATEASSGTAWNRYLYYDVASVSRYGNIKSFGYSVRCLSD